MRKSLFLILILSSCLHEPKTGYPTLPNTLDVVNTPASHEAKGLHAFFDQGSWFGYALHDSDSLAGFAGPYIQGLDHGLWLSNNFLSLDLQTSQTTSDYYPGRLTSLRKSDSLQVYSTLLFNTSTTSLTSFCLKNTSIEPLTIAPKFSGSIFPEMGTLEADSTTLRVNLSSNQVLLLKPSIHATLTLTDSVSFTFELSPRSVASGDAYDIYFETAYHPDSLNPTFTSPLMARASNENTFRWNDYLSIAHTHRERLILTKSICTLINNWRSPAGELTHSGLFPSYHYKWFQGFWAWDSWKHAAALARIDSDLAKDQIRTMYHHQDAHGMIADCVFRDTTIESHNWRDTKPPLSAWAIFEVYKHSQDLAFLEELYPKLKKYHKWWYTHRDYNKNGLCEYGSTDSTLTAAKWESGMDNAIRFDDRTIVPNTTSLNSESVDLNAYLALEKLYLHKIAKALNHPDSATWLAEHHALKKRVQTAFYDTTTNYFYDIDSQSGGFQSDAMGPEGWTPLWCDIATEDQTHFVASHMLDSLKFNTHVPLPTIDISHPEINPHNGYWRGPVWLDQCYFGIDALRRAGYTEEADSLTQKVLSNCAGLSTPGLPIRENYHPLTGEGLNAQHFSWSAAHLILLLDSH